MKIGIKKYSRKMVCEETKLPELKSENDVMVKVLYGGICGSDINRVISKNDKWNNTVFGHEIVGIIDQIGVEVKKLKIGDKVAVIPLMPCFNCIYCDTGHYSLCKNYKFMGSGVNGGFAEYVSVNEKIILKLPQNDDLKKYILLEPLTIAIHAIYRTKINIGQTLAILGAGPIGVLLFQLLSKMLMKNIVITDINNDKLAIIKKFGAIHCINPKNESVHEYIKRNLNEDGVHITFEATGNKDAIKDSIFITKGMGEVILIGNSSVDIILENNLYDLILRKELSVLGSWMSYSNPFPGLEWEVAKNILEYNIIDVASLITHEFSLQEITKAFDMIIDNKESFCKVIINI